MKNKGYKLIAVLAAVILCGSNLSAKVSAVATSEGNIGIDFVLPEEEVNENTSRPQKPEQNTPSTGDKSFADLLCLAFGSILLCIFLYKRKETDK